MKAWGVTDSEEGYGVIVFAETRSRARTLGHKTEGLDEQGWIDPSVRHLPEVDGKKDHECVASWQDDYRIYYEAGWFADEARRPCDGCDRCFYEQIPHSEIGEDGLCGECRELCATPAVKGNGL